jgi:mRNA-degrading endonuclease RelE of RelBE toxin-antitoxin system
MASMRNDLPRVRIEYTLEFKRNLGTLAKKYRHIRSDVQPIIDLIQGGNFVGDRIPGTAYVVFKARVKNSDISKGKSAGYRLIYHIQQQNLAILVTLYSKLDQSDIAAGKIKQILKEFNEDNC